MKKKLGRRWVSTSIENLGKGVQSSQEVLDKINKFMVDGTSAEHEITARLGLSKEGISMTDDEFKIELLDKFDKIIGAIHLVEEQLSSVCHELAYIGNNITTEVDEYEDS